jgi:hypothetical protein
MVPISPQSGQTNDLIRLRRLIAIHKNYLPALTRLRELKGNGGGTYSLHYSKSLSVGSDTLQAMDNLQGFEGLSALEESAVRLHEVYKSLLSGGFTEDQALTLIAKMTRSESES